MSKKKNNICLIIDPSDAYLRTITQEIYTEWGFNRSSVKQIEEWKSIPKIPSLFGEKQMTHLDLTKTDNRKKFVDLISNRKTTELFTGDWFGNGVIITASKAVGTKKIEKLVQDSGGYLIKNEKSAKRKAELFGELHLANDVKSAVDFHVGEDYDLMLSFYNEVSKRPASEQKAITIEEALNHFPPVPGSVPPWDYLNSLMNGNTTEAIELFNRTVKNTHVLVTLVFLIKKMNLLYRVRLAMDDGIRGNKQIAQAIGENGGPEMWSVASVANKVSSKSAESIAIITANLESDIKGGSSVDHNTLFIVAITKIGAIMGNKR